MPVPLDQFMRALRPERTVLLFGSGSSIPSGAPSVDDIQSHLATRFQMNQANLTLPELAAIIEKRQNRSVLIATVRELFANLRPTGGLLTIPQYKWKNIYTTNYDDLIEQSYKRAHEPLSVYASNFDFGKDERPGVVRLLKLHGSIQNDISDGHQTRLILTEADYDLTEDYRQFLYDSLKGDLAGADLVIIGHSLADPDVRQLVRRAISLNQQSMNGGSIHLFMYTRDEDRAELQETQGLKVCFAGIDDFATALTKTGRRSETKKSDPDNPLETSLYLSPITLDVEHSLSLPPDVGDMFNGWPASYGDIAAGNTFARSMVPRAEKQLTKGDRPGVVILGAGGVGKTTAARQLVARLAEHRFFVWEHKSDHKLLPDEWLVVAQRLEAGSHNGVLLIDDADNHLYEINSLFELLSAQDVKRLRLILCSARNRWNPRVKSPALFTNSNTYELERFNSHEINELLRLIETSSQVRNLVDSSFMDFSPGEQRRRLEDRCERDMFVCLKNIFASEKFDDILLREYAALAPEFAEIYKIVAALESSGVRVHRQLIIRLLGIDMTTIPTVLDHLDGIVREYVISEREGIYGWRGRHGLIMEIIADYKFAQSENFGELYDRVIGALNPTYDVEVRTLRQLCSINTGIRRIPDRREQNRLLAKMISVAPGERVPRHRLVRNLIELRQFEQAEAEIRLFVKDFNEDGPVFRYRVILALERARNSPGLLEEDRLVILERAKDMAKVGVRRYKANKNMLSTYCDVGIEIFKRTKDIETYQDAIKEMKAAEEFVGDPDISRQIAYYERRVDGII
ncbi:hypothetical protein F4X86_03440 [Candidatus Saccharibacteria bacterium]|nr:hypothetical protein [Candidatus Saccharibacteria bacterium]